MSKVLFEIPIYILRENEYYLKWENKKRKFVDHQIKTGGTLTEANDDFIRCYRYEYLWDYNKLVGFVQIRYDSSRGDLVFDVYKQNKKMIYNAVNKMKFDIIHGPNLHIFVRNKTKDYIIEQISKELVYIQKSFFQKKHYFDMRAYDNVITYFDIVKLIEEADCQK